MSTKNFLILFTCVLTVLAGYYGYEVIKDKNKLDTKDQAVNTAQAAESNSMPKIENLVNSYRLPEGDQTYTISHGKVVKGPKATKIAYSPLAIKSNTSQTITVIFPKGEVVSSAIVFITTDNQQDQKVTLVKSQSKEGVWAGTWTPTDTINKTYNARLYFVGPSGTYNNIMTFL